MATALEIRSRQGSLALINGFYEPLGTAHNGRGVWVSRDIQPLYLFHTGKSRWVVSKRLDDGARCYAFLKDSGTDPLTAPGPWVCCDDDGEWREDPKVVLADAPASEDKFVHLRRSLDDEMNKYGLNDSKTLKQLWRRLDINGNNIVSLAEVDRLVVELVAGRIWPAWLSNKPALMRAFKKTTLQDGDGDDWVQKWEFHALLLNIFWFNKLWQAFSVVDTGQDRRIDAKEFLRGLGALGLRLSEAEAAAEFARIDRNGGGQVLFGEFCEYVRGRLSPGDETGGAAPETHKKAVRRHTKATQSHYVTRKALAHFDELEQKIKSVMQDKKQLRELWNRLDYNGNGLVSLAEIDKFVVEAFPLLNHKPALMRAYQTTIREGNGDDWVDKSEFKSLLGHLFYFNKVFWLFDHADSDNDRRLTFDEFKWFLSVAGVSMTEGAMRQDFAKVDTNGGGVILFDEFCKYFTSKACPECLVDLLD